MIHSYNSIDPLLIHLQGLRFLWQRLRQRLRPFPKERELPASEKASEWGGDVREGNVNGIFEDAEVFMAFLEFNAISIMFFFGGI